MFVLIRNNTLLSTLFSLMALYVTLNILDFRRILEPLLTQQNRKYLKKFRSPLPHYISFSLFSTFARIYQRNCRRQTLGRTTWMNCLYIYIYLFIHAGNKRRLYPCSEHISLSTQLSPQLTVPLLNARLLRMKEITQFFFNKLLFLGEFEKYAKSDYRLRHVCPSVRTEQLDSHWRIFIKFGI